MCGACAPRPQVLILNGSLYVKRAPEQDSFNFYAQSGAFLLFARVLCRWAAGKAWSRLQPRLVQGSHGAKRADDSALKILNSPTPCQLVPPCLTHSARWRAPVTPTHHFSYCSYGLPDMEFVYNPLDQPALPRSRRRLPILSWSASTMHWDIAGEACSAQFGCGAAHAGPCSG